MFLIALYSLGFLVYIGYCAWDRFQTDRAANAPLKTIVSDVLIGAGVIASVLCGVKAITG